MGTLRTLRYPLLSLLIAAVLVQGVVSFAPHRHEVETVHTAAVLPLHLCTHDTPEVLPIDGVCEPPPCLACVIQTPAFHSASATPFSAVTTSTAALPLQPDHLPVLTRRWRQQLRAPPSVV